MFSSNSCLTSLTRHAGLLLFKCHMSINVASCLSLGFFMWWICILWSNLVHTFIPPSHNLMTHSRRDLWNAFQCVCVSVWLCVGGSHHHHAMKQSILATISPFHAKARAKWSSHAQTVGAIDLSYVIWNDFCVIISLVLCDPDRAWNEWVCVCLRGWCASFYIWPQLWNTGYSTC